MAPPLVAETPGELHHRPGAPLSAGSQTVLPTVRFSPATSVEFTAAANTGGSGTIFWDGSELDLAPPRADDRRRTLSACAPLCGRVGEVTGMPTAEVSAGRALLGCHAFKCFRDTPSVKWPRIAKDRRWGDASTAGKFCIAIERRRVLSTSVD